MYAQSYQNNEPSNSNFSNSTDFPQVSPSIVSSLAFQNATSCVTAGFWSGDLQVWRVQGNTATPFAGTKLPEAVLSTCEQPKTSCLFAATADGSLKMFDLSASLTNSRQIAKASAPIPFCSFSSLHSVLLTGDWAGDIHLYDLRQEKPCHSIKAAGRIAGLSVSTNFLVYGTNEKELFSLDLRQSNLSAVSRLSIPVENIGYSSGYPGGKSTLDYPIQDIRILKDEKSVVVAQSSGSVTCIPLPSSPNNSASVGGEKGFSMDLHVNTKAGAYDKKQYYSANSVLEHSSPGVFCSSGGDGRTLFVRSSNKGKMFIMDPPMNSPVGGGECGGQLFR